MSVSWQGLSAETEAAFDQRLDQARLPAPRHAEYRRWVRFYLCFCQKFGYPPTAATSLGPFLTSLAANDRSIEQRHHAAAAVKLFLRPQPLTLAPQLSPNKPVALARRTQSLPVEPIPLNELNRLLDLGIAPLPWGNTGYLPTTLHPAGMLQDTTTAAPVSLPVQNGTAVSQPATLTSQDLQPLFKEIRAIRDIMRKI